MDMGIARNLGVLPSDIADAALLYEPPQAACQIGVAPNACNLFPYDVVHNNIITPVQEMKPQSESEAPPEEKTTTSPEEKTKAPTTPPPISAYLFLLMAILSISATGPFFNVQHNVDAVMKIFWRNCATNVILLPMCIMGILDEGWPKLDQSQWVGVFLAGLSYSALGLFFVLSLDYTSVGNAMILYNSQLLLLMFGKFFVGEPISHLEFSGAMVAFTGAVFCSIDAAENDPRGGGLVGDVDGTNGTKGGMTLLGDLFALCAAFGGVGYLVFAQTVRSHLNLYVFMFFNMFQSSVYAFLYVWLSGQHFTFDMERYHGMFAWLLPSADRLFLTIVAVVFCNLFGVMGYIRAMHFFDKLVISVAGLMEPVASTLLAYAMGVGLLPGYKGWIGNIFVFLGTFAVIYQPTEKRTDSG
jgi:drug/metabolite transporter (DMT)-like permease